METTLEQTIETAICEFPLCDYAFLDTNEIVFTEAVRTICHGNDCGMYGKRWVCPPVIGSIEDCIARCQRYRQAFLFSTVAEVDDIMNFAECLSARADHEAITQEIAGIFQNITKDPLILSTGCIPCSACTYPEKPCRNEGKVFPTIESHGILIMQMAAQQGINYDCGGNSVTYFSLILYNG